MSQLDDATRDGESLNLPSSMPIERPADRPRRGARRFARRIDCAPALEPRETSHTVEKLEMPKR